MTAAPLAEVSQPFLAGVRSKTAEGPRPRQILLTLLGDYWLAPDALAPSGALVELMAAFDIPSPGARSVLSRLAKDERVVVLREGRRTSYRLSDHLRHRLLVGLDRIGTFGFDGAAFDGVWTCVAFSVPEEQRSERHKLRTALSWLGFAPLYDGLWVTPRRRRTQASEMLHRLGVSSATVFEGALSGEGSTYGVPTDAWDLTAVRGLYEEFLAETEPVLARLDSGQIGPKEALVTRTELINVWRTFPRADPDLPLEMLPADWPRGRAREVFHRLYDGLAAPSLELVRDVVERHGPEYVRHAQYHSAMPRLGGWVAWGASAPSSLR
ncbi:PaaX family transcriptional regulator C-terminal domain-containing protein [Sinomonas flava]|uniref:PaaX family transcriptional regulator n=1 Tax=Sinomonas flava TaxID=496857 RepID=UPI0039A54B4B